MSNTKSNGVGEQSGRRFSQEQYQLLKRCSKKKDMSEWNEWRKDNTDEEILLEGAYFGHADLVGANLFRAYLRGARFYECNLKEVDLRLADLEDAELISATLERARLAKSNMKNAKLSHANVKDAELWGVSLEGACLGSAHLVNTNFSHAYLSGACFDDAELQGTDFSRAFAGGETSFWESKVDRHTDFRGVGLGSCSIDPGTRQLLEYNIRRMNWEDWYKKGAWWLRLLKRVFIEPFWWMSDYGRSTVRVIITFFALAFAFAIVYYAWGLLEPPGIVSNLFELEGTTKGVFTYELIDMTRIERQPGEPVKVGRGTAFARAVYFSVVTQTTLGFGDMYANAQRIWGHVLLSVQVILGYVLLGALVTRFAVLFTAGGPAGKFSKEEKDEGARGG